MRRHLLLVALLASATVLPAWAETPAERASRQLQQGVGRDRAAEAGQPEGPGPADSTPVVRAMDSDRRSIQPDVGRQEENGGGVVAGERGGTIGGRNPQR